MDFGNKMSGVNVPRILDPSVYGMPEKKKHTPTLSERLERAEHNFPKYYEREIGTPLTTGSTGIVLIQQGYYPYNLDIFLNAQPSERCESRVLRIDNKLMQKTKDTLLLFTAHSYWLENEKLIKLLSANEVLSSERCESAVKIICKKMNTTAESLGEKLIAFGREAHPYRVYRLSGSKEKLLFINLMNAAIFIIPANETTPEMKPLPETFVLGDTTLALVKDKNYKRY